MEKTARTLVERYLQQLSAAGDSAESGGPVPAGLPDAVRFRLELLLYRNLDGELRRPAIDWADGEHPEVHRQWERYAGEVRKRARIPSGRLEPALLEALSELINLLVQPRKYLTGELFGGEQELTRDQLAERITTLPGHSYLVAAVLRYMERKGHEALDRSRFEHVLIQIDEKLSERSNALQWAERLEPLFELTEGAIPSELLRLFFDEKKFYRAARRFDLMERAVSRDLLVEEISSPELLSSGQTDEPMLFDTSDSKPDELPLYNRFRFDEPNTASLFGSRESDEPAAEEDRPGLIPKTDDVEEDSSEESAEPLFGRFSAGLDSATPGTGRDGGLPADEESKPEKAAESIGEPEADDEEESLPLYARSIREEETESLSNRFAVDGTEAGEEEDSFPFSGRFSAGDTQENEAVADDTVANEDDDGFSVKIEAVEDTGKEPVSGQNGKEDEEESLSPLERYSKSRDGVNDESLAGPFEESSEEDESESDDDEGAIWKQFLSAEEGTEQEAVSRNEAEPSVRSPNEAAGRTADSADGIPGTTGSVRELHTWIGSEAGRFRDGLFRGSEEQYRAALRELSEISEWRQAARYIQHEIFVRQRVDMFEDVAVDFTDRMQEWYTEKRR